MLQKKRSNRAESERRGGKKEGTVRAEAYAQGVKRRLMLERAKADGCFWGLWNEQGLWQTAQSHLQPPSPG